MDLMLFSLKKKLAKEINDLKALSPFIYKGSVNNFDALPKNAKKGDVYTTLDTEDEYLFTGAKWIKMGNEVTTAMIESLKTTKQENLYGIVNATQYLRNDYYEVVSTPTYSQYGKLVIVSFTLKCVNPSNSNWQIMLNDLPLALNSAEMICDFVPRCGGVPIRAKINSKGGFEIAGGQTGLNWTDYYDICYTYIAK